MALNREQRICLALLLPVAGFPGLAIAVDYIAFHSYFSLLSIASVIVTPGLIYVWIRAIAGIFRQADNAMMAYDGIRAKAETDAEAQFVCGLMHLEGRGLFRLSEELAFHYFRLAANGNHARARTLLQCFDQRRLSEYKAPRVVRPNVRGGSYSNSTKETRGGLTITLILLSLPIVPYLLFVSLVGRDGTPLIVGLIAIPTVIFLAVTIVSCARCAKHKRKFDLLLKARTDSRAQHACGMHFFNGTGDFPLHEDIGHVYLRLALLTSRMKAAEESRKTPAAMLNKGA